MYKLKNQQPIVIHRPAFDGPPGGTLRPGCGFRTMFPNLFLFVYDRPICLNMSSVFLINFVYFYVISIWFLYVLFHILYILLI